MNQQWNLPLDKKIELINGLKMRDSDKVLGLAPKDYALLKKYDLIDLTNKFEEEAEEDDE